MHFGGGRYELGPFRFVTFVRWDVGVGALICAFVLAHLPEVLGERYRQWRAEA